MIFQVIKATWLLKMNYFLNKSTDLYQILGVFYETHIDYQISFRKDSCTYARAICVNLHARACVLGFLRKQERDALQERKESSVCKKWQASCRK